MTERAPADILIEHGLVVTMDPARRMISDGAVAIRGERVVEVGKTADVASRYDAGQRVDASDCLVTPGLIDGHNHPIHYISKGLADDMELSRRSYRHIWPFEAGIDADEAYVSSLGTFAEMIRHGTTCFCDPGSYQPDAVARAAVDIGIRGIVAREVWDVDDPNAPPGFVEPAASAVDRSEAVVERWNGAAGDRIRAWFSLVRPSHVSDDLCRLVKARADARGVGIHAHMLVSRTRDSNTQKVTGTGSSVVRYERLGVLGPNLHLVHLGWIVPDEIALLKAADVKGTHCPSASMLGGFGVVANGTFPEMFEAGVCIGLGTDAGAISRFIDMVRVMYVAATAHKDVRIDPEIVGPYKAFEMATIEGARAVLWEDAIGSLEPGKKADIAIFETSGIEWHPAPLRNPIANIVYSATGSSARTVLVDGRIVMEDKRLLTVDTDQLLADARRASEAVLGRLGISIEPRWAVV